jgi:hypothetical protein
MQLVLEIIINLKNIKLYTPKNITNKKYDNASLLEMYPNLKKFNFNGDVSKMSRICHA